MTLRGPQKHRGATALAEDPRRRAFDGKRFEGERSTARATAAVLLALACIAALVGSVAAPASAQTTVTGPFVVDVGSREEVRRFYQTVYRAADNVPAGGTGDLATCTPGTLPAAYLNATLSRVNWFRAMAGVPSDITFAAAKNALAQAAGVLQATRPGGGFEHSPPNTWRCWTQAGFDGSRLSNLGGTGPGAIDGWMFDVGANNAATGHRRWVLDPAQVTMGHGGVPGGAGALHVLEAGRTPRPVARDEFVAWPTRGFVPYGTVYSRWSFSLPPAANMANATVSMRRGGTEVPLTIIFRESDSGLGDSVINWRPTMIAEDSVWPRPAADETYTVTVANVVLGGVNRTFTYDVTIFDPQVADPTETRAVITGPDQPPLGQPSRYTFNPVPNATGYQWRSVKITPLALTDGAETGLGNFTPRLGTGAQEPLPYSPVSTDAPAAGTSSFRLTSSVVGGPQTLTFSRALFPTATSQIRFRSRAEMLDNHAMRVEVSSDDGVTWTSAFDQAAPTGRQERYSDVVVPLGPFAGRVVQVRFALVQTGGFTWTCCGAIGWYFDDIAFENLEVAAPAVLSAATRLTELTFSPTEAADYLLQVRPEFFSTGFGDWGPVRRVSVAAPAQRPAITTQPAGVTVTAGAPVTLSVAATGTAPLQFIWQRDGVALVDGPGVTGAQTARLTLTPAVAGSYTVAVSNAAGTVTSLAAVVVVNQPPPPGPPPGPPPAEPGLADAIDTNVAVTTSGTAPWTAQRAVTRDGVDAAQSGRIVDNQSSTMQVTVRGPATVTFWWKVESEPGWDFLNVSVDGGAPLDRISGNVDWAQKRIDVPAGDHTVAWSYTKDATESAGADTGWVDQLAVSAAAAPLTLLEALDVTGRNVDTAGNAPWTAQRVISRDGIHAAQSGRIADNQSSTLRMLVNGPATVSFWWRVDSEPGWDFLNVSIDGGAPLDRISGNVDWAEKKVDVPAGFHTINWTYTKDASDAAGADAGWVDLVR